MRPATMPHRTLRQMKRGHTRAILATALVLSAGAAPMPAADAPPAAAATGGKLASELATAPQAERDLIERLRHSPSWVRRAFAAERLGRFDCDGSATYLRDLLGDESWRVRAFATLALARRRIPLPESAFAKEPEQRVIRTALRCRYAVPRQPLIDLVTRLNKSERLTDRMMSLELLLAAGLADADGKAAAALDFDPLDTLTEVITRMDRIEAGELSPRLSAVTGGEDSGRSYKWRDWLRKKKRDPGLHGGFVLPPREESGTDRGPIAALPLQRMLDLEGHLQDLSTRSIDLAIALDCTSSMAAEIAECQSGIDSLMLFAQDVAKTARVGIVGYRDEKDDWETKGWNLTASLDEARDRLWQLSADGGGDRPESVLPALRLAYGKMSWAPDALKYVILVGDAPPRPGTGDKCVTLARKAFGGDARTRDAADDRERVPSSPAPQAAPGTPAEHPTIKTFTIAPHAGGADESRPAEPSIEPPADDPAPPNDGSDVRGPTQRKAKRPLSPWRQELEPGGVEYWKEIAEAGGGRSVSLPRDASVIAEIAGLTLGSAYHAEFDSFFASWFALCR